MKNHIVEIVRRGGWEGPPQIPNSYFSKSLSSEGPTGGNEEDHHQSPPQAWTVNTIAPPENQSCGKRKLVLWIMEPNCKRKCKRDSSCENTKWNYAAEPLRHLQYCYHPNMNIRHIPTIVPILQTHTVIVVINTNKYIVSNRTNMMEQPGALYS